QSASCPHSPLLRTRSTARLRSSKPQSKRSPARAVGAPDGAGRHNTLMRFGGFLRTLGFQIALAMSVLIVAVNALVVWQVDVLLRENEYDRFTDELLAARAQLAQQIDTDRELSVTG